MYEYSYDYSSLDAAALGTVGGAIAGMMTVVSFVSLAIAIVQIIAMWKVFTKAGEKGWKCLIPIYNNVILFRIAGLSPWLILAYLAVVIPVVGTFIVLGLTIYLAYNLAKSFGKGAGFTVGLVLLAPIFYMILGFGSAEYVGNTVKTTEE